jgi:hypothetical protein
LFVLSHPEIGLIQSQFCNNVITSFFADICWVVIDLAESESFLPVIMLTPQLLLVVYFATLFITFYFSFYSSPVKEEAVVDYDYTAASITVESEKELGSLDDYMLMVLTFMYIFGWYFYINF